jgi:hypothetical protein
VGEVSTNAEKIEAQQRVFKKRGSPKHIVTPGELRVLLDRSERMVAIRDAWIKKRSEADFLKQAEVILWG